MLFVEFLYKTCRLTLNTKKYPAPRSKMKWSKQTKMMDERTCLSLLLEGQSQSNGYVAADWLTIDNKGFNQFCQSDETLATESSLSTNDGVFDGPPRSS